jgi:hypothetical protein
MTDTELSISEMDSIIEVQCNTDPDDIPAAIDKLNDDQLVVLLEMCQESIERQTAIIALAQNRLTED